VDGAEGGALDRPPDGAADDLEPARLGLPEKAGAEPPRAPACPGGVAGGPGRVEKNLSEQVEQAKAPGATVEVGAFDEHRIGLKPIRRRQWAPVGRRPVALSHHRYEWLSLYGFVHPSSGRVEWFLVTTVTAASFSHCSASFAREVGAGRDRVVVLVLANAGWPVSDRVVVPDGLVVLPPYAPELQPAECLWPLADEAVANRSFATLDALDAALAERCRALCGQPDTITSRTLFHWWPEQPHPN
jgi:hypothetical protein